MAIPLQNGAFKEVFVLFYTILFVLTNLATLDISSIICQVFVNVVHVGVGPLSQSDLDIAQACGACIIGFNIKTPPTSLSLAATRANIKVLTTPLLIKAIS